MVEFYNMSSCFLEIVKKIVMFSKIYIFFKRIFFKSFTPTQETLSNEIFSFLMFVIFHTLYFGLKGMKINTGSILGTCRLIPEAHSLRLPRILCLIENN